MNPIYDVCIDNLPLKIDKDCNVFMIKDSKAVQLPLTPRSSVIYRDYEYRVRDMYLRTFYGDTHINSKFDANGLPYYDLASAMFYRTPYGITINTDEFRPIPGIDGYYVSRRGVVYSTKTGNLCRQKIDKDGYHKVNLSVPSGSNGNSAISIMAVHRLVYLAWVGPITDNNVVHHKDEIVWHNTPENLDDVSNMENVRLSARRLNTQLVHEICKMMQDGVRMRDIAAKYGYSKEKDPRAYYRFVMLVRPFFYPRSLKHWKDIVMQYDLSHYKIHPDDTIPYMEYLAKYADKTYREITEDEKERIREGLREGKSRRVIAEELKMSITTVARYAVKFRDEMK